MKLFKSLLAIVLVGLSVMVAQANITAEPTFISCSIYFPSENPGLYSVYYKEVKSKKWLSAFTPTYDKINKEYRLSIVRLKEDTPYEVKVVPASNSPEIKTETIQFKTWTSLPKIAKTITLSSLQKPGSKALDITGLKGTSDGWIKIIGDIPVNAGTEKDFAIQLQDCHYVMLEGVQVKGGYRHGIYIGSQSSNIRINKCDISNWGRVPLTQNKEGVYLDKENKGINNDAGIRVERAKNIVVERCYIHDPNGFTNPWDGVVELGEFKGQAYKFSHPQGPNGIYIRQSGGGIVIRYNDVIGSQTHRYNDPIETASNGDVNGGFNKDADIYGNLLAFGQDDGIELDGGQCNVRFFDNRIEQVLCGISTAPNKKGPSYIFNTLVWNPGNSLGVTSVSVKNGGGVEHSLGTQYFFHNTMISNGNGLAGIGFGCSESECKRHLYFAQTRNNIFYIANLPDTTAAPLKSRSSSILDQNLVETNSYDYDMIANSGQPGGVGKIVAAPGNESHGIFAAPIFTNPLQGIFTLKPTDKGIDKGTLIPNFSTTYNGSAPDLGAFESGVSSLTPARPIAITSDKYFIMLRPNQAQGFTLTAGKELEKQPFTVQKSEDMDWLTIEPATGIISPKSAVAFKVMANTKTVVKKGMIFIRLANGLSVPVTVFAK